MFNVAQSEYAKYFNPELMKKYNSYFNLILRVQNILFKQNPELLKYTDAKVHDIFVSFDNVDEIFLDDEWRTFEEFVADRNCEIIPLKRSSSKFYITNSFLNYYLNNGGYTFDESEYDDFMETAQAIDEYVWGEWGTGTPSVYHDEREFLKSISYWIEDNYEPGTTLDDFTEDELYELFNGCWEDIIGYGTMDFEESDVRGILGCLKDAIACHDYIKQFKDNQVQIYQDFLDANDF